MQRLSKEIGVSIRVTGTPSTLTTLCICSAAPGRQQLGPQQGNSLCASAPGNHIEAVHTSHAHLPPRYQTAMQRRKLRRHAASTLIVLSMEPVTRTQSSYLHQSAASASRACARNTSAGAAARASHTMALQSPLADTNTSACCAFLQMRCSIIAAAAGCFQIHIQFTRGK